MATVYHIPVCTRCRSKKIRCDTDRPRCRHCARADTSCEFVVSTSSQNTVLSSRDHISVLERKLYELEVDYALSKLEREETAPIIPYGPERTTLKHSTVKELMKTYFSHCQFPYLILREEEFSERVEHLYTNHGDLFANSDDVPDKIFFMISMVIVISLLSLTRHTPRANSLAEAIFTMAIDRLNRILSGDKDVEVLQCVLLLLLYCTRHYTSLVHAWYISGIFQQICWDIGLHEGVSSHDRTGLYMTSWSMDLGLSKTPFRLKEWAVEQVSPVTLQEQQTMHFIQLQELRDLVATQLYPPSDKSRHEDKDKFVVDMANRLEEWKVRAQQLAAANIYTTGLWKLWYSGAALHLLRPPLLQQPVAPNILQRCYSLSTEIIDVSFTELFIQRHIPVTYSWKDICDIILAAVTFLYILSTSADVIEDDASSLSKRHGKLMAVLKILLENWPNAARAQPLLLSLAKHTMDNIHSCEADTRSEAEQQRLSKRPKTTVDTHEVSNLPCLHDDDVIELPVPRTKVRRVLARQDSESKAQKKSTRNTIQDLFFNHEFVRQHHVRIMSTILKINPPQTQEELSISCDEMNAYRSFVEFVDLLHGAAGP